MPDFTTQDLQQAIGRIRLAAQQAQEGLCAADAQLGDGDLGITFTRGWTQAEIDSTAFSPDWGLALLALSKSFQQACSSSFGTLMATAFMAAAKGSKGKTKLTADDIAPLLAAACAAMQQRGKGELGQKSVLDIVDALARDLAPQGTESKTREALRQQARASVEQTLEQFRPRPNLLGRARMFAEKSQGLDDPGMLAIKVLVNAL